MCRQKAHIIMGISQNDIVNKTEIAFCCCVELVCPQLECWAWFWSLLLKKRIEKLENAQKRMTKMIEGSEQLLYKERLKMLRLLSSETKKLKGL